MFGCCENLETRAHKWLLHFLCGYGIIMEMGFCQRLRVPILLSLHFSPAELTLIRTLATVTKVVGLFLSSLPTLDFECWIASVRRKEAKGPTSRFYFVKWNMSHEYFECRSCRPSVNFLVKGEGIDSTSFPNRVLFSSIDESLKLSVERSKGSCWTSLPEKTH